MYPTYSFFMLAQRSVDYAHIKQDFTCVCNLVELDQGIVKFIVVVAGKGSHPSLDFLFKDEPC